MYCLKCGKETDVTDSRLRVDGTRKRSRLCMHCGEVFITREISEEEYLLLKKIKKNKKLFNEINKMLER